MSRVRTGLDRWMAEGPAVCALAHGARIGVLAHPASIDSRARHVVEWLHASREYELRRLFAPEHGLWGHEQDMEAVEQARDPLTGQCVVSLYGTDRESLRPRPEHLADLDAVVVDLQDVGSRYYTFIYTMSHVMEAAGAAGVPVVVLDRPNPIGGEAVEGPVLDPSLSSFVGRYALPVRHAMTIGELARMFRDRFRASCDLRVVQMQGWRRTLDFEETGLPWVPPSPNMPTAATTLVYPGGCLIEGCNLSEGRGTTLPFELVGAPWIDAHDLAARMCGQALPGALFRAASFRPMFQKHAGSACNGVQIIVDDQRAFRPFATYLVLLREAREQAPQHFAWRSEAYEFETERPAIDYLLGRDGLREAIERAADLSELEQAWQEQLEAFLALRRDFLLYS